MATEFEQVALDYLALGWSVIPIRSQDKCPAIRWQEYQAKPPGRSDVLRWARRWPDANVGVVTGAVSGLVVLDVDLGHGGMESLRTLELEHGPLPPTLQAISGGGGRHLYFAHPGGIVRNRVGIVAGIDARGDGGCIVMPPSIHPSGTRYRWAKGFGPHEVEPAQLPHWLRRMVAGAGNAAGHALVHWRALLREGVREGQRNSTVASVAGHLLWHGVDPQVTLELMICWNRVRCYPPLDEDEVVRTVKSITRLHEREDAQD